MSAKFIGHPLADAIPLDDDRSQARARLGLPRAAPLLALLPGSRRSEVGSLARPFMETAAWLQRERPELEVAVALASEPIGEQFRAAARRRRSRAARRTSITARAREVMTAADVVLTASGTASLEALLLKRPMVVAHRIVPLTYWIVRRLGVAKLPHFSLPNLLAGRGVVPEFVQDQVRPEVLGPPLLRFAERRGDASPAGMMFSPPSIVNCAATRTRPRRARCSSWYGEPGDSIRPSARPHRVLAGRTASFASTRSSSRSSGSACPPAQSPIKATSPRSSSSTVRRSTAASSRSSAPTSGSRNRAEDREPSRLTLALSEPRRLQTSKRVADQAARRTRRWPGVTSCSGLARRRRLSTA